MDETGAELESAAEITEGTFGAAALSIEDAAVGEGGRPIFFRKVLHIERFATELDGAESALPSQGAFEAALRIAHPEYCFCAGPEGYAEGKDSGRKKWPSKKRAHGVRVSPRLG